MAKLTKRDIVGHVFHDEKGFRPEVEPEVPIARPSKNAESYARRMTEYEANLRQWARGEIQAYQTIIDRLDPSIRPTQRRNVTAKQLFDEIAEARVPSTTLPYLHAYETLSLTTLMTTADNYCSQFTKNLQEVNIAADVITARPDPNGNNITNDYKITPGQASGYFIRGTKGVEWLDTWRQTRTSGHNGRLQPLGSLMSSLREAESSIQRARRNIVASIPQSTNPEARCRMCRHKHMNEECFKQHPELASVN